MHDRVLTKVVYSLYPLVLPLRHYGLATYQALHHIIFQGHICISSGQPFLLQTYAQRYLAPEL